MNEPAPEITAIRQALKRDRPAWLRILIWIGIAFLLFNTVGVALFFLLGSVGNIGPLLVVATTLAVAIWGLNLKNVLRTWGNKAAADFTRRDDPATGGIIFDVQPARAARTPAVALFAVGLLLLLGFMASGSFWFYLIALVFLGVGCTYVVPGARYRRPVKISVSAHGIQSEHIHIALEAVADLRVGHNGLVVDPDMPVPGPNGVPLATMAGRAMGRRQAERGYMVQIRADGEGQSRILAGGLTLDCATALVADISKAAEALMRTHEEGAGASGV